jgi:methionyl-tRNA formyltransferase
VLVEDAHVDWEDPALGVDRRIRACTPAPGAWTTYAGERVKLGPVTLVEAGEWAGRDPLPPGRLAVSKNAVHVGTGTTAVRLGEVKPFGKKQMPAADWARGVQFPDGATLGD